MRKSSPFCGTLLLSLCCLIGCRNESPPAQHPATTPFVKRDGAGAAGGVATQPADAANILPDQPSAPDTAKVLAQRAATYAKSVEPVNGRHAAGTNATTPEWPDPQALHLTPQPDPDQSGSASAEPNSSPAPKAIKGPPQANASIAVPTAQRLVVADNRVPVNTQTIASASGDGLGAQLAQRARDYPSDLSAQVDDQLLRLLRDETVADMSSIAGLIPEDRELLSAVMDSLTNFRSQLRADNNMLFSKKIRPLLEMADRLRSQAELSVPTVALCTGVKAFGVYDPIDPARFIAGREQRVVVYCEVENFLSQPNEKNLYETRLTQDIVLYEESSGLPVWTDKKSTYVDQARRRRHDFFMGKIITLPANLTINRYLLKVTVEDQQARHIAENTVPIEIVAQ
jgi:hypothetical protein